MVATQTLQNPFAQVFGGGEKAAPLWPQEVPMQPQRHPSRPRLAYHLRGKLMPGAIAIWGEDEIARLDRQAAARMQPAHNVMAHPVAAPASRGKAVALLSCTLVGVGVALVMGFGAQTTPQGQSAALAVQDQVITQPTEPDTLASNTANIDVSPVAAPPAGVPAERVEPALPASPPQITLQTRPVAQQPLVADAAPGLSAPALASAIPNISDVQRDPIATARPDAPIAVQPGDPFTCATCVAALPRLDGIVVAVFANDMDAAATQGVLRDLGPQGAYLNPLQIDIATHQVRYYRTTDEAAARALAARYDATLVDLSWFSPTANTAKIDVLLASTADPANPAN